MDEKQQRKHIKAVTKHPNDILCGRGNGVQYHPGNVHYRNLINNYKINYVAIKRHHKKSYCKLVYKQIKKLNPPGRFLKAYDSKTEQYYEVDEIEALFKIGQAFREGASDLISSMKGQKIYSWKVGTRSMDVNVSAKPPPCLSMGSIPSGKPKNIEEKKEKIISNKSTQIAATEDNYCTESKRRKILVENNNSQSLLKPEIVFSNSKIKRDHKVTLTKHPHDILCGRGNGVQYYPGNVYYRNLINSYKINYVSTKTGDKSKLCKLVYNEIKRRDPPGRFLKAADTKGEHYDEVEERIALFKIGQAFREGASDIINSMRGMLVNDDEVKTSPTTSLTHGPKSLSTSSTGALPFYLDTHAEEMKVARLFLEFARVQSSLE